MFQQVMKSLSSSSSSINTTETYKLIIRDAQNIVIYECHYKTWQLSYNGLVSGLIQIINKRQLLTKDTLTSLKNHLCIPDSMINSYLTTTYDPTKSLVYERIISAKIFDSIIDHQFTQTKVISVLRFISNTKWEIIVV